MSKVILDTFLEELETQFLTCKMAMIVPSSFIHHHPFIHSFTNYVLCTQPVPAGLVPGTEDTIVSSRHHAYSDVAIIMPDNPVEEMT